MTPPSLSRRLKIAGRRLLPEYLYQHVLDVWRTCRSLPRAISTALHEGMPDVLLTFGAAPGDDLMCTAVARELTRRGRGRIWMMSSHPGLFEENPDVARVVPRDSWYAEYARVLRRESHHLAYAPYDPASDTAAAPARHIIAEMCARIGVSGEVALRPYLLLADAERAAAGWARGVVAVQSSGMAARHPMRNKEWFPERFQAVVDALTPGREVVQVGSASDPPLAGVRDLRGRTSLRETAAVLSEARLFLGLEGFLMHLARAVECPAVIVFGGRTAPWQVGYSCYVNLYTPVSCAPCWARNTCAHDRRCMRDISAAMVIEAVERELAGERTPLPVETLVV